MRLIYLIIVLVFLGCNVFAQQQKKVLNYDDFISIVEEHHPVMVQASEVINMAQGELIEAKGGIDPMLKGDFAQKEFREKKYYQLADAGLVIPTWIGANLKVGYAQSIGDYVSAMDVTPANGLVVAGIQMPIGQGLFYDKRRAAVDKAKIYLEIASSERTLMVNELIYQASMDYWDWFGKYHQTIAVQRLIQKSEERLNNIKRSAELGDKPYVDTLEASIQYQNFQSLYLDLSMAEKNAKAYLNTYLWADGLVPLELDSVVIPESMTVDVANISEWILINDTLVSMHPKLSVQKSKVNLNEVELRLAKEYLKPKLNINYNMLHEPVGGDLVGFNLNDYKFGVDLSIPIFLRSSRGQIKKQQAELVIAQSEYEWMQQQLKAKLVMSVNKSRNAIDQSNLLGDVVKNYRQLVDAERKLYEVGESSLMMLNYREIALMESEIKWIEKISKSRMAELEILYAVGQLRD